jgi:hypothetical protein
MFVFVGAGVSIAAPTAAPGFDVLCRSVVNAALAELPAGDLPSIETARSSLDELLSSSPPLISNEAILGTLASRERRAAEFVTQIVARAFVNRSPNLNHVLLAQLLERGATLWCTNYDLCIERCVDQDAVHVCAWPAEPDLCSCSRGHLFKPHGTLDPTLSLREQRLVFREIEVLGGLSDRWRAQLERDLTGADFFAWGHSGRDADLVPAIVGGWDRCSTRTWVTISPDAAQYLRTNVTEGQSVDVPCFALDEVLTRMQGLFGVTDLRPLPSANSDEDQRADAPISRVPLRVTAKTLGLLVHSDAERNFGWRVAFSLHSTATFGERARFFVRSCRSFGMDHPRAAAAIAVASPASRLRIRETATLSAAMLMAEPRGGRRGDTRLAEQAIAFADQHPDDPVSDELRVRAAILLRRFMQLDRALEQLDKVNPRWREPETGNVAAGAGMALYNRLVTLRLRGDLGGSRALLAQLSPLRRVQYGYPWRLWIDTEESLTNVLEAAPFVSEEQLMEARSRIAEAQRLFTTQYLTRDVVDIITIDVELCRLASKTEAAQHALEQLDRLAPSERARWSTPIRATVTDLQRADLAQQAGTPARVDQFTNRVLSRRLWPFSLMALCLRVRSDLAVDTDHLRRLTHSAVKAGFVPGIGAGRDALALLDGDDAGTTELQQEWQDVLHLHRDKGQHPPLLFV